MSSPVELSRRVAARQDGSTTPLSSHGRSSGRNWTSVLARSLVEGRRPGSGEKSKVRRHSDGDGLYLIVDASSAKRRAFIFRWEGELKEIGFGGTSAVSLAGARDKAGEARLALGSGANPIEERKRQERERSAAKTFSAFADPWMEHILEASSTPATGAMDAVDQGLRRADTRQALQRSRHRGQSGPPQSRDTDGQDIDLDDGHGSASQQVNTDWPRRGASVSETNRELCAIAYAFSKNSRGTIETLSGNRHHCGFEQAPAAAHLKKSIDFRPQLLHHIVFAQCV